MHFLEVKNLSQFFGKKQILNSISLNINPGEVVALLGPNGAGKTTLLRTIMGLNSSLKPTQNGSEENYILLNNKTINQWPICKRVENGLLYLPQQPSLFRDLSVTDNLKLVFEHHPYWQKMQKSRAQKWKLFKAEMLKWLDYTSLIEIKKQLTLTLSGGQKRKLEVVRSLLMHPEVIMLDEPFAGVDPKSIYELKKIFVEMANNNIAVLISDHHVDQLLSIATRIYVVINGQVITSGGIKEVIDNKYTKEMYLGNQFYSEITNRFL